MKTKNKKKQIPLLLIALLLISLGAYGTRAYFTDSASTTLGLSVQMGTVSISLDKDQDTKWDSQGNAQLENAENGNSYFVKALPGDSFKKKFIIKNTGTLNQRVSIDKSALKENLKYFDVSLNKSEFNNMNFEEVEDKVFFDLNAGIEIKPEITLTLMSGTDFSYIKDNVNKEGEELFNSGTGFVVVTGQEELIVNAVEISPQK